MVRELVLQALEELVAGGAPSALAELRVDGDVWRVASGTAELSPQRDVAVDGWFRIGSVTKTFTATVVLQLVGEGMLRLDDAVERWLPGVVPEVRGLTVRHLLDHTSGLAEYTADLEVAEVVRQRSRLWRPVEVVAEAVRRPPRWKPGAARAYSNTGYVLLGLVIESVTGRAYADEVDDRIARPLGLTRTSARSESTALPEPHAHGYLAVDGALVDITECSPSQAWAAGGMVSTAADLNRFFAAVLTGGLLRPAQQRALMRTVPTGTPGVRAGLGIAAVTLPGGRTVWGKDGTFWGYYTLSFHSPDATRQLTLSVTLARNTRPATPDLLARLAPVIAAA